MSQQFLILNHLKGTIDPNNSGSFDYIYQYKDHLGNIRLSYKNRSTNSNPVLEIQEENNYYPFGLEHKGYSNVVNGTDHKYKYNGKELQDELGLNMIAMDFRQHDPAIGRFVGMDRLSELAYSITPYRFVYNNPVYWNDPTGLFENTDLAHCPTCPNTSEFKPLIDDPNNTYYYDAETMQASFLLYRKFFSKLLQYCFLVLQS